MTEKLQVNLLPTGCGRFIGHLQLNKPSALNALDLEMAKSMQHQFDDWRNNDAVLMVVISGSGPKAFCAGGDIVSMYQAMQSVGRGIPDFITEFFATEYRLDYTIHTYQKPVIAWGEGIVMGGGIGLLAGASHRILTRSSRLAMPEISIGLYPDVGASYFLPRAPGKTGLFAGLTGASINATDGVFIGLGDYVMADGSLQSMLTALGECNWQDGNILAQLNALCSARQLAEEHRPDAVLAAHQPAIDRALANCESAQEAVNAIRSLPAAGDEWLSKAQHSLNKGSPITMHLVWQQIRRGQAMSLDACFEMELIMSCRCAESGEFAEGVRALLIDKDKQPQWRYNMVEDVPDSVVQQHFTSPWQQSPLTRSGE